MKLFKPAFIFMMVLLAACDKAATEHNFGVQATDTDAPAHQASNAQITANHQNPHGHVEDKQKEDGLEEFSPIITKDGKTAVDWRIIDTKEPKANLTDYNYPIALNSDAVKKYAAAYHITDKQAQHSMVIAMASPEALGKLLDQLEDKYLSHQLTDGANVSLIITTKADVVPEMHEYVFADSFGRGLVLPIIIKPVSTASDQAQK